jgi:hypothetical protein
LPNAEHLLKEHRISLFFSLKAFYLSILENYKRPNITWIKGWTQTSGNITLFTDTTPIEVNAYFADTEDAKR